MHHVPSFVPNRFESTVDYYVKHRLRYPPALMAEVFRLFDIKEKDRILDLGCGPGTLTIDMARLGAGEVIGADPDPAMLVAARAEAKAAGADVVFIEASSYHLPAALAPLKLVTMARSFHWMDRAATLQVLDRIIEPGGAVVLVSETPERAVENQWKGIVKEVQRGFTGEHEGGSRHHAVVLLASAFSNLTTFGIIERRHLFLDEIVGRAFSELQSSPESLAEDKDPFEKELRSRLLRFAPDGRFSEVIQFSALMARRSG